MFLLYTYSFKGGLKYQFSIPTSIPKKKDLMKFLLYGTFEVVCYIDCLG